MAQGYKTGLYSFRYRAISCGKVPLSSISNHHCPYQSPFRIHDFLLGITAPESLELTAQELHLPTSTLRLVTGGWVQAWGAGALHPCN